MTKEEMIEHWMEIVRCVFTAEHNVIDMTEWLQRLKEAKASGDDTNQVADAYVRAVAEECLKYEKFEE